MQHLPILKICSCPCQAGPKGFICFFLRNYRILLHSLLVFPSAYFLLDQAKDKIPLRHGAVGCKAALYSFKEFTGNHHSQGALLFALSNGVHAGRDFLAALPFD